MDGLLKKLIEDEFDNTLDCDPYFYNKDTNTQVGTIYKGLQQQKQELCKSIFDPLSEFIKTLPYPLTPDQPETMRVLRQGIRGLTKIDELVFRSMELTASRILKNGNSIIG